MCCALLVNADLSGVKCPVPGQFGELSITEIMQMMQENDVTFVKFALMDAD
jgi:hypothetical protein